MKIQAIQNSTNFRNRRQLKVYRDSFIKKNTNNKNTQLNSMGLINGTLLGISACGFIGAFTDGLKMLIPAFIAGASAIAINLARFSKNKHTK